MSLRATGKEYPDRHGRGSVRPARCTVCRRFNILLSWAASECMYCTRTRDAASTVYTYPMRQTARGMVKEHRYLMEKKLGRKLHPIEVVHHKNGIKTDNRLRNLQVMTRAQHAKVHGRLRGQRIRTGA